MKIQQLSLKNLLQRLLVPNNQLRYTLDHLYSHTKTSFIALIVILLFISALYPHLLEDRIIAGTDLVLIGLLIDRLLDNYRYQRIDHDEASLLQWKRRFWIKAMLTAGGFGFLSMYLLLYYQNRDNVQFLTYFLILGISAGALGALFVDLGLLLTYWGLINLPTLSYLILRHDRNAIITVIVILFFLIVLFQFAWTIHNLLHKHIEQNRQLRRKERELFAIFNQNPTPIFYYDTDLKIRKYNPAYIKFFDIPDKFKLERFNLAKLHYKPAVTFLRRVIETGKPIEYEGEYITTFTDPIRKYWLKVKAAPLYDEHNRIVGGIVNLQDKSQEKASTVALERLVHIDPLTKLKNRRAFEESLSALLRRSDRKELSLLFFIDLNRFKPINDTMGHTIGDEVLRQVAGALQNRCRNKDEIYRFGGDEFVVLFRDCCSDIHESKRMVEERTHTINEALQTMIRVGESHLPMSASIGVVVIDPDDFDTEEIIRQADLAMYSAKQSGKPYAFYDEKDDTIRTKNFILHQELNRPELEEQLFLEYQPIVSLADGHIVAAEALIRWRHPKLGLLMPGEFIPIAVENGDIERIGRWAMDRVCKTIDRFEKDFSTFPLQYISLNVDSRELFSGSFAQHVQKCLECHQIPARHLAIEITETSLIRNFAMIRATIDALQVFGIRWAIDDFGTGYSSLSYLEQLRFSILKVDRSFSGTIHDAEKTPMIDHIIRIARDLRYDIVVEGIETIDQIRYLEERFGSLNVQGYYFHRPMSEASLIETLQNC